MVHVVTAIPSVRSGIFHPLGQRQRVRLRYCRLYGAAAGRGWWVANTYYINYRIRSTNIQVRVRKLLENEGGKIFSFKNGWSKNQSGPQITAKIFNDYFLRF